MKKKKENLFKVLAIVLPLALLLIIEAALRFFNYGNSLDLFIADKKLPEYIRLNDKVSLRYFLQEENATNGNIEPFKKIKTNGSIRIFVQGESTAVGFPYFHNGAFPRMMDYYLKSNFPDKDIELVNLSMTALNSYALYDFADEILEQSPDAVIINAGHNEYYGALGIGSTGTFGNNVTVNRLGITLRKTKIGQLLSGLFRTQTDKSKVDGSLTLMERMVKEQEIPFESDKYYAGLKQFEQNLDETLAKYHKAGIPVYLCNAVSNLKDLKPFVSLNSQSNTNKVEWLQNFTKALTDTNKVESLAILRELCQTDSVYALLHYFIANRLNDCSDYGNAYWEYIKAKEYDALRFRAPEAINEIIEKIAKKYDNVTFIDVNSGFREESPHGIIGEELILEHVHPNLRGHFIIAKSIIDGFKKNNFPENYGKTSPFKMEDLPLTETDSLTGEYANLLLHEGWPFNEPLPPVDTLQKSFEEAVAGALAVRTMRWEIAMDKLYRYYLQNNDKDNALKIAEGLALEYPYEYIPNEQACNLAMDTKQYDKAERYGKLVYRIKQNNDILAKLVILYLKMDAPEKAVPYIDKLIADKYKVDFSPMKEVVKKILLLKAGLNETDTKRLTEISELYRSIGNAEMALKYQQMAQSIPK